MLRRATALKRICDRQRVQNAEHSYGWYFLLWHINFALGHWENLMPSGRTGFVRSR